MPTQFPLQQDAMEAAREVSWLQWKEQQEVSATTTMRRLKKKTKRQELEKG